MTPRAGTIPWFAAHELRLAWRDFSSILTAGRRRRTIGIVVGFIAFALFMHGLAFFLVRRFAWIGVNPEKDVLLYVTVIGFLSWSLLVSQALEAVTRAFYARADLDLILSSPTSTRRVFAVRIGAIALTTMAMALLLAAPFINMLAVGGGGRWLLAYPAVAAMGASGTAVAVGLAVLLFRTLGPRRTRFAAQILAALIGAAFVIGLQGAAILSYGTISRFAVLQSEKLAAVLPDEASLFWQPARALMGEAAPLVEVVAASLALLALAAIVFSGSFANTAIAAAGAAQPKSRSQRVRRFRRLTAAQALRRKEWTLLIRDPWLVSQTLMQLLYLAPPALLLWLKVGEDADAILVIVPVIVVAAGQLAGGLAWLAVSGEDAPELVATAPVRPAQVVRAKVEAVLGSVAFVTLPLLFMLALAQPLAALVAAVAITLAGLQATAIQLIFRAQAKRSQFRRRQTSSRVATFGEAFSSMAWAATAGLFISGSWAALGSAVVAALILVIAWASRPKPQPVRVPAPPPLVAAPA